MSDTGAPVLRMMHVSDQVGNARTVLKLEVAPPAQCTVAVILDLSDSCATMQVEISRLPRLLEALPRSWPVWIYRLSDTQPVLSSATLAHLCDGSVDLMRWAGDRRTLEKAQATGSYLLPPLEAIIDRAVEEKISRIKVLVLTDGELLDSGPLAVPQNVELIGLTAKQDVNCLAHWNRVLPRNRLCLLSDPALDACFRDSDSSFYGSCQIDLACLKSQAPILHFDVRSSISSRVEQPALAWNFMDGPLLLQVAATPEMLSSSLLTLTSLRSKNSVQLSLKSASSTGISPQELAGFSEGPTSEVHSLFEVSTGDENFPGAWSALCEAARMARDRASWIDEDGRLRVFKDAAFRDRLWNGEGNPVSDSWLCLCSAEPGPQPLPGARIVILELSRNRKPALQWHPGEELPFGSVDQPVRIEFDVMEDRWIMRYGSAEPRELNPRGSQEISIQIGDSTKCTTWKAYFSGSLRLR